MKRVDEFLAARAFSENAFSDSKDESFHHHPN